MKYSFYKYITITAIVLIHTQCAKKLVVTAPEEAYKKASFESENSSINVLATVSLSEIQKKANKEMPELLYDDSNMADDKLMIKVRKKGDIQFSVKNGFVQTKIPLSIYAKTQIDAGIIKAEKDATFELEPVLQSSISLSSDWNTIIKTNLVSINWLARPEFDMGFMKFDLAPLLEKAIFANQNKITEPLDKKLSGQLIIKPYADRVWQLLVQPFKIPGAYNSWIRILPLEVNYIPLSGNDKNITIGLQINGKIETHTGTKPETAITPLPYLNMKPTQDSSFNINLLSYVEYSELTSIVNQLVSERELIFEQGKNKISILKMEFYGSYEQLIIKASTDGTIKGDLYLKAIPYLDTVNNTIRLKNVAFDIKTNNFLQKSANWILNGVLERKIEKKLIINYKPYLETSVAELKKIIQMNKITPSITLNGDIYSIVPNKINLVPGKIILQTKATGYIKLLISDF
ncbi:MAG: DUF4403 family protein [Bacteroidota bacterium]|nr:DUF4403 family protein [Bacteroidota bacterium]